MSCCFLSLFAFFAHARCFFSLSDDDAAFWEDLWEKAPLERMEQNSSASSCFFDVVSSSSSSSFFEKHDLERLLWDNWSRLMLSQKQEEMLQHVAKQEEQPVVIDVMECDDDDDDECVLRFSEGELAKDLNEKGTALARALQKQIVDRVRGQDVSDALPECASERVVARFVDRYTDLAEESLAHAIYNEAPLNTTLRVDQRFKSFVGLLFFVTAWRNCERRTRIVTIYRLLRHLIDYDSELKTGVLTQLDNYILSTLSPQRGRNGLMLFANLFGVAIENMPHRPH